MRHIRSLPLIMAALAATAGPALTHGDTVFLKNGHNISGHIIDEDGESYTLETGSTTFEISTRLIERVIKYTHRDTSLVLLGDERVEKQDYGAARRYYERALAITQSPAVIRKRIERLDELALRQDELAPVETAIKRGEYRLAADLALAIIENPEDQAIAGEVAQRAAHAHCMLAQQYYDAVRTEEAVFELRRALDLDPYNAKAHSLAGLILARSGHYRQAREELLLAQEIDPAEPLAAQGLKLLEQSPQGLAELKTAAAATVDARRLDELLGEAEFTGHTEGILYSALGKRARSASPVRFDLAALGSTTRGGSIYQFRTTRALSIFLQAYNAGPGAAAMYNGNVPYTETVNYVQRVAQAVEDIASGKIGPTPYDALIEKYAREYGFHPTLIKAIVKVESDFNPECVSTADARGLIQLVRVDWDDTMKRLNRQVDFDKFVFDPELNLMVGCHYLRWLVDDCLPIYFEEEFG